MLRRRDILQVVNTLVENVLHYLRYLSWGTAEAGLALRIECEINLEEGHGILELIISLELFFSMENILDCIRVNNGH